MVALGGLLVALSVCTTSNTIDGHQVRGTASPETPVEQAAREFREDVGKAILDAYGDDPQVQAEIRKLRAEREGATENSGNLHRDAPGWMHQRWAEYLDLADGNYAVLALDRNGHGVGIVYCRGDCGGAITASGRSWRDVNYKHGALENCRESVRTYYPAVRPDCAIYAIKDKIV